MKKPVKHVQKIGRHGGLDSQGVPLEIANLKAKAGKIHSHRHSQAAAVRGNTSHKKPKGSSGNVATNPKSRYSGW